MENMKGFQVISPDELSLDSPPRYTSTERRKCKINHCITILECHNENEYCHLHQRAINLKLRDEFVKKINLTKSKR